MPVKAQKRTFWLINLFEKHLVVAPAVSLVLGMLTAIVPPVSITSMFPNGKGIPFPFSGVMAAAIILGVCICFASLMRLVWVIAEDL